MENIDYLIDNGRQILSRISVLIFNNRLSDDKFEKNNFSVCDIKDETVKWLFGVNDFATRRKNPKLIMKSGTDEVIELSPAGIEYAISNSPKSKDLIEKIKLKIKNILLVLDEAKKHPKQFSIYTDNDEYYYRGKKIQFNNLKAIYFLIFQLIYEECPTGGSIPQDVLLKLLKEKQPNSIIKIKTIYNALSSPKANLFRYTKNLPYAYADGTHIFKSAGKNIHFENKHR